MSTVHSGQRTGSAAVGVGSGASGSAGASTKVDLRADRLRAVPPFLFNQIDDKKRAAIAAGKDVINLGVGDPDKPTPAFIIDAMDQQMRVAVNHQYPDNYGTKVFLSAVERFMHRRFGVRVDPSRHVVALIGSKDGIAHLPLAIINPGDSVVVFKPAYPVYAAGAALSGGTLVPVQTTARQAWRPDFAAPELQSLEAQRAKLMWLNFPGNPTGATADVPMFERALAWAAGGRGASSGGRPCVVASDLAYSEVYFDSPVPSLWQARGADLNTTLAVEFHSLSKTFNMTGWRVGFAVGHESVIAALKQVKDNYDSGVFNAIQNAAAVALDRFDDPAISAMRGVYRERRDVVVTGLRAIGCDVHAPEAGIFVWARCPIDAATGKPMDSWGFVGRLIDEAAVVTVPGAGFAESATGFVRVSLTRETARIAEAMQRLSGMAW